MSIATGSVTIGLMLTGRFVFQYLGWGVAAAATPCIMALTGSAFFGMSLAAQYGTDLTFGPYTLAAAGVVAGAVTQVCCIMHIQHCASCICSTVHHAYTALCIMHIQHCASCVYSTVQHAFTALCIMHIQHCASCIYSTVHHACTARCQLSGLPPKRHPQEHSSDPPLKAYAALWYAWVAFLIDRCICSLMMQSGCWLSPDAVCLSLLTGSQLCC